MDGLGLGLVGLTGEQLAIRPDWHKIFSPAVWLAVRSGGRGRKAPSSAETSLFWSRFECAGLSAGEPPKAVSLFLVYTS